MWIVSTAGRDHYRTWIQYVKIKIKNLAVTEMSLKEKKELFGRSGRGFIVK